MIFYENDGAGSHLLGCREKQPSTRFGPDIHGPKKPT